MKQRCDNPNGRQYTDYGGRGITYCERWKDFENFLEDMGHSTRASRDWRDHGAWFCSEFVAWTLESSHFFPYTLVSAKNRITPADLLLLLNPFLSEDNIKEF